MEDKDVVLHQDEQAAVEVVDQMQQDAVETQPEAKEPEETRVPLSALQKERKKRQELEMQIEWERQQRVLAAAPPQDDTSKYESATKEDLAKSEEEIVRKVEERTWIKHNQDKFEEINERLPEFLKQRPHLAHAINSSPNRYEEAWTLMEALSPKQKQQLRQAAPKREAPGSPAGIPKAAALNQALDVMTMSDEEFAKWRMSKKTRR